MLLNGVVVLLSTCLGVLGAKEQIPLEDVPSKFPWIRKFASIGDSYAAGLGAGTRLDWSCSRYSHAYPYLLQNSLFGHDSKRTHQFLACTGATSTMILETQVPALDTNLDLITISAGGNDIGLTPILSDCIYQFYMAGEDACEKSMQAAQDNVADEKQLYRNVTELIEAIKPKMNQDHGVVYVTGYAGFFGAEDEECDKISWSVWKDIECEKQYLKLDMRKALNEMVRSVNAVIRNATQAAGPNVRFIDYDSQIEAIRGRYCESGVQEPEPNRKGLAFYEWNTVDAGEDSHELQNKTGDDVPRGSFEGGIAERINKTLQEHPDWQFDPEKGFVNKSRDAVGEEGFIDDIIHWLLPDAWKRVFHMRPEGHAVVARLLLEDLKEKGPGQRDVTEIDEL